MDGDFYGEFRDGDDDLSRVNTNRTVLEFGRRNSDGGKNPVPMKNHSFLRSDLNPSSSEDFAVETAIRAGCSPEGIEMIRRLGVGPSEMDAVINKLGKEDGDRLSAQLNEELTVEWKTTSLFDGLGVDDDRIVVGDSLLRTYDLLSNINLQLIVMQRELLKHENNIIELRSRKAMKTSGYDDSENQTQLRRLLCSLTLASQDLQNRIASLNCVALGVSPVSRITSELLSTRTFVIACLGVLGVSSLFHRFRILEFFEKLKMS